jgi:hypothetical protein
MLSQALNATFRILLFRAGPQDFPFAQGLMPLCIALAAGANALMLAQVLPVPMAIAMALAMVAAMALVTRSVLRARNLLNRYQQTFNALLATTAVLTLALLPAFVQMAPAVMQIAKNPQLLETPDAVKVPAFGVFWMNLLNIWNFAVTAHIFRHAAGVQMWVGLFIAFVAAGIALFLGVLGGSIGGVLFGVATP